MADDRDLLQLAAKAAGYTDPQPVYGELSGGAPVLHLGGVRGLWDPLGDDGDALRLAVKLELVILIDHYRVRIGPRLDYPDMLVGEDATEDERCNTVRRAIAMTAAQIGAAMRN